MRAKQFRNRIVVTFITEREFFAEEFQEVARTIETAVWCRAPLLKGSFKLERIESEEEIAP